MGFHLTLAFLIFCAVSAAQTQPGCAPTPEIEQILRPDKPDPSVNSIEILEKAVASHPDDFHLLAEYLVRTAMDTGRAERVKLADRLRTNPQGAPAVTLAALSWLGVETPKAIEGLKSAQSAFPAFPWLGYFLAAAYSFPRFRDNKQGAELAAVFLESCPDYLPAYSYVSRVTMPDVQRPLAARLRARLESPALPTKDLHMYSALWTLEFRAAPVDQHAPLREQVKRDLERIKSFGIENPRIVALERTAAQLTGDAEAQKLVESRIRAATPTADGMDEYQKWSKENPYPKTTGEQAAHNDKRKEMVRTLAAKYPKNPMFRDMLLNDQISDRSKSDEEITALAAEYLRDIDGRPTTASFRYRRVARLWIERSIHMDQVPGLLEQSQKSLAAGPLTRKTDLMDMRSPSAAMVLSDQVDHWNVVALYERKRGNAAAAAQANREIEALLAANRPAPDEKDQMSVMTYWSSASSFYKQQADQAEQDHRMLDALAWFRKTIDADRQRPMPFYSRDDNPVMKKVRELWAALGGSPGTFVAWLEASPAATPDKPKPAVASIGLPPRRVSIAMPAMDLKDVLGKTWTLANIQGKATLINFWATWCGPCREELPHLQKLFNKTRERKDVQVITLNMDENPGVIEPFLKQNNYTFPVLLAKDYADAAFKIQGIPTNYLTDASATVKLEYIGFGGNGDDWIEKMLADLELHKAATAR